MRFIWFAAAFALPVLLCGLVGCGSSGPQRETLSGEVTLNGEALPTGSITFAPQAGGETGTSAEIIDGKFAITDPQYGLSTGDYKVEITSAQKTGVMAPGPGPNGMVEEIKQIIPARYNLNTELTATITSTGENQFSFPLTDD
ncbi:MAG: hypothetical protein NXI22_26590 [bacterium]|nr:hypothetical protein [bacterium]